MAAKWIDDDGVRTLFPHTNGCDCRTCSTESLIDWKAGLVLLLLIVGVLAFLIMIAPTPHT